MSTTRQDWGRIIAGAAIGAFASYFVGIFVLRAAAKLDFESGWEDLISIVASMLSFAPVGAVLGAMSGVRVRGEPIWRAVGPGRRAVILVITALAAGAAFAIGWATWDPISAVVLAVWTLPIALAIAYGATTLGARELGR